MQTSEKVDTKVIVTGATGYIAGWLIIQLLEEGYSVVGTVRSLKQEDKVSHLRKLSESNGNRLDLVEIDLLDDVEKWKSILKDSTYVCHTASPFIIKIPEDEQLIIKPAVEGTTNVLLAAAEVVSIKRVVLTSSVVSISAGYEPTDKVFTEEDWSIEEKCQPYPKSKLLAEKAAWDIVKNLPSERGLELVTINPSYVIGPLLTKYGGESSRQMVLRFMNNDLLGVPELQLSMVDVRDVANAHVRAMTNPNAAGNRYLCSGSSGWMMDVANILSKEFSPKGYKIQTMGVPKAILWLVSWVDDDVASIFPSIGKEIRYNTDKIKKELGIEFRSIETGIIDMAYSLIDVGLVPKHFK